MSEKYRGQRYERGLKLTDTMDQFIDQIRPTARRVPIAEVFRWDSLG